jgi:hypothetical protein
VGVLVLVVGSVLLKCANLDKTNLFVRMGDLLGFPAVRAGYGGGFGNNGGGIFSGVTGPLGGVGGGIGGLGPLGGAASASWAPPTQRGAHEDDLAVPGWPISVTCACLAFNFLSLHFYFSVVAGGCGLGAPVRPMTMTSVYHDSTRTPFYLPSPPRAFDAYRASFGSFLSCFSILLQLWKWRTVNVS